MDTIKTEYNLNRIVRTERVLLLGGLCGGVLLLVNVHASQWTVEQFSDLDPVLTFETGSTALPSINGIQLSGYGSTAAGTFSPYGFGQEAYGNVSGPGGFTYLDISFDQPQQAVGGYVLNTSLFANVTGVTEIVYDKSNNVIESASVRFAVFPGDFGYAPVFLGIGETTTNIFRVEWQYTSPGFFGVDNVIYHPGSQIVVTNVQSSVDQVSFTFQTLPGHTNVIQNRTNLLAGDWTSLTNFIFLGDGSIKTITVPTISSPAGYFRVQVR